MGRSCTREAGSTGASGTVVLSGEGQKKARVPWVCAPLPAQYEWLAAAPSAHALGFSSMSLLMGKGFLLARSASGETCLTHLPHRGPMCANPLCECGAEGLGRVSALELVSA